MNKQDDILIQLIKKIEPASPGPEFTNTIMDLLEMDVEKELNADIKFADYLTRSEAIYISHDLTHKILRRIDSQESSPRFLPLIGKRIGLFFIFLMLVLIAMSFFVKGETAEGTKSYSLSFLYEWMHNSSQSTIVFFISIISLNALLLVDYMAKNKWFKNDRLQY